MKILVVGAFDFVNFDSGGQPVKTRELYYALQKKYGESNVSYFETEGWKKSFLCKIIKISKDIHNSDAVIMLPAANGVKVLPYLLFFAKRKNTKLFYSVIGGWLSTLLQNKPLLTSMLKKFNGVWVETTSMKSALEKMGFQNIAVVKNFKTLNIIKESDINNDYQYPLRLCTFSRVLEKKGIGDAVKAIIYVNQRFKKVVYTLDIFGPIDEEYADEFAKMQESFPNYIQYKGEAKPNESVEILRNYFALLFPTKFYTEGIPGTIIDAYSAGIPVISSLWRNASDIFISNKTGIGYDFGDYNQFLEILIRVADNPLEMVQMRPNCLKMAYSCSPEIVIKEIKRLIETQ